MHVALWILAAISLVGAGVSMLRPAHVEHFEVDELLEVAA
jgi:hypothetical protein